MREKHKANIIFRVMLILLCLVLFSAHLSSGMLAKYATNGIVGASARVAKTGVTITSETEPTYAANGTVTYSFNVLNDSEVAIEYSLVVVPKCADITAAQLAAAFVNPKIDNVAGVFDAATGAYTFSLAQQVVPGEDTDHTLTFMKNDIAAAIDGTTLLEYKDISLDISVKAVQLN